MRMVRLAGRAVRMAGVQCLLLVFQGLLRAVYLDRTI
jgi:hypothetical protein